MKRIAIAAALVVSAAAFSASLAASDPKPDTPSSAEADQRSAPFWGDNDGRAPRLAEGFFDHLWDGGRHRHHWDDDDGDDEDGSESADRGGANRPADPNAQNAPVPDSGVFNGKARPKVEVQ
jgi:hypothetical protein